MTPDNPNTPAPLPLPLLLWCLVLVDASVRYGLGHSVLLEILPRSLLYGSLYTLVLWTVIRLPLERITLLYLALPYLFFIPGWLNLPAAAVLSIVLLFSLQRTMRHRSSSTGSHIHLQHLGAFLLILAWVSLSGAGEGGWQSPDWRMHNARLHDLATQTWPIRYGADQNLVYYMGYFLPAAALGKITSFDIATQGLFFWTLLGVALALRWLALLCQWRFSFWLAAVFVLFGPLDLLNVLLLNTWQPQPWPETADNLVIATDFLHFRSGDALGFFAGNYLSNTFQLFWSPQQVIAGWLGVALLTHCLHRQQFSALVFTYALLCLWAPMPMIALLPLVLWGTGSGMKYNWRAVLTVENIVGASTLALLFIVFYASGSGDKNLSFWLHHRIDSGRDLVVLALLALCGWGLYAVLAAPQASPREGGYWRSSFLCLLLALALLPLYVFGDFSDLLCRGSAPLMFLLLVFLLRRLRQGPRWHQLLLAGLLLAGSASALQQLSLAWEHRGHREPVSTIPEAGHAFPNLGPDGTPFERWLRKPLPTAPLP